MTTQHSPLPMPGMPAGNRRFRLPHPNRASLAVAAAMAVAFVALLAAIWLANEWSKDRAIRELPDQERKALYEHTMMTLETVCSAPRWPNGLAQYCRDQAELAARFPECDARCRELAERFQRPSR
jgi:hypothetical protein